MNLNSSGPIALLLAVFLSAPLTAYGQDGADSAKPTQDRANKALPVSVASVSVADHGGARMLGPRSGVMGGTTLKLLVTAKEEAPIIAVLQKPGRLDRFTDDQGTDLTQRPSALEEERRFFSLGGGGPFGGRTFVSKKGAVAVPIYGPGVPAQGAQAITAAGMFAVRTASATKTITIENAALKPGKLQAEGHDLSIQQVNTTSFGDAAQRITLRAKGKETLTRLAEIRILNSEGKNVGKRRSAFGTGRAVTYTYVLSEKLDRATIELVLYDEVKTVKVPFDVTARLGFAAESGTDQAGGSVHPGTAKSMPKTNSPSSPPDSGESLPKSLAEVKLAGQWELDIKGLDVTHQVTLKQLGPGQYLMTPKNLVFGGKYVVKGDKLIFANPEQEPNFRQLQWKMVHDDQLIAVDSGAYTGDVLRRQGSSQKDGE